MSGNLSRLNQLLDQCLDVPEEARREFVLAKTADEPELRDEALQALQGLADPDFFMRTGGRAPPDHATSATADTSLEGRVFGAWTVGQQLGSGGMGRVFAASRSEGGFQQAGALKLSDGAAADPGRFQRERQVLADLEHPGIARIFDGGIAPDGTAWLVMERIDGQDIVQWCNGQRIDATGRIDLVIQTGDVIAAAHARLVLHRDLKPSNILIDQDGRVRVIDFGVAARMTQQDVQQTVEPIPVSLAYAAPELLKGDPPGPPSDVYGLACVLWELLTGSPPIELPGLPPALAVTRLIEQDVESLSRSRLLPLLSTSLPAPLMSDLGAILSKALRKRPQDRYATMESFCSDLRDACSSRPVSARQGERGYRMRRYLWRNRWLVGAGSLAAAGLVTGTGVALWQAHEAGVARDAAVIEADRAEAVRNSLFLILGEATEAAGPDGSRKDVLDRAASRLQREFAAAPARYAPILKALGELYFHSNDYPGAMALLGPLARLPLGADGSAPHGIAPEVIAEAKVDLVQVMLRVGEAEAARPILNEAQAFFASHPRWETDLVDSRLAEAQLIRELDKDLPKAEALLTEALARRVALSGADNRDVAIFQNNIGMIQQANGDLEAARVSFSNARETWSRIGASETPDALNTLNNLASIEMLAGRAGEAVPLFEELVRLRRALFGPSAALAALINNLGKAQLASGQPALALANLIEATAMAQEHAGAGSLLHVSALTGVSEAQVKAGNATAGLSAARQALQLARGTSGAGSPAVAVALVALVRAEAAGGNRATAVSLMREARDAVTSLGPAGARVAAALEEIASSYDLQ